MEFKALIYIVAQVVFVFSLFLFTYELLKLIKQAVKKLFL